MNSLSVDEYIASAPKDVQDRLEKIRRIIKVSAPESLEKMSYGMPYYEYKGPLAYFAFAKKHIGLYIPPPIIREHIEDLEGYETATATVRFPLNKELPLKLIEKLVMARVKHNEGIKRSSKKF